MENNEKRDKRKLNRWHRRRKAAEKRINTKIHKRIEELKKDKSFMEQLDKELDGLTPSQLRDYSIKKAHKLSEKEVKKLKKLRKK